MLYSWVLWNWYSANLKGQKILNNETHTLKGWTPISVSGRTWPERERRVKKSLQNTAYHRIWGKARQSNGCVAILRTKLLETGSAHSVTVVILSDNAQEAPISGPTRRKLTPKALDTNITIEYHTNCSHLTQILPISLTFHSSGHAVDL
jgi:hypothetical protein